MTKMSHMAGKFDSLMKERGSKMIRNFSISRSIANGIDKVTAARNL
jgi:hypothetical protein